MRLARGGDGEGARAEARKATAADRLARLCQRLAVANARVAQAEEVYRRERAKSVVSTWKYVAVEVPALCIQLKGVEAARGEVLATCQWRVLQQMEALPSAHRAAVEERNGRAARRKGTEWLDATL